MAPTGLLGNLIRERREPEILGVEQSETLFRSRISANPTCRTGGLRHSDRAQTHVWRQIPDPRVIEYMNIRCHMLTACFRRLWQPAVGQNWAGPVLGQ